MSRIYEYHNNPDKLHRLEFEKAWKLWKSENDDEDDEALDIVLGMRMYSNLSLFPRAWVNNIIGAAVDMEKLDVKKLYDEALGISSEMPITVRRTT